MLRSDMEVMMKRVMSDSEMEPRLVREARNQKPMIPVGQLYPVDGWVN
jgi:hypothetical protein